MSSPDSDAEPVKPPYPAWCRIAAVVAIVLTPAVLSWLAIRVLADSFYQPAGGVSRALWMAQALVVAVVVTGAFQFVLKKIEKAQAFGGLSALLELPKVGAIASTASTIPASAPFIAAVSIATASAAVVSTPIQPPTALAFEDPVAAEVRQIREGGLGGAVDGELIGEFRVVIEGDTGSTTTTTLVDDTLAVEEETELDEIESGDNGTPSVDSPSNNSTGSQSPSGSAAASSPAATADGTADPALDSENEPVSNEPEQSANSAAAGAAIAGSPSTNSSGVPATPSSTIAPNLSLPTTTAAPRSTTTTTRAPAPTTTRAPAPTTTTTTPPAPATPPAPTGSGFVVLEPNNVSSFAAGQTEVANGASVLVELGPITLTENLQVARADSTPRDVGQAPQVTIAAGTTVCSYYIHFDVTRGSKQTASIDFGAEIVGHTDGSEAQLRDTSEFGLPGIDYAIVNGAGAGRNDVVSISGTTAEFEFTTNPNNRDDVRFFVACG